MVLFYASAVVFVISLIGVLIAIIIDNPGLGLWCSSALLVAFVSFLISASIAYCKVDTQSLTPTAIDVYRGKTTLEITYRDSVAIDSTVVYKVK